ncbi:MAG: endo-1,4-beta-xylanase [Planctomycetota bacterium]
MHFLRTYQPVFLTRITLVVFLIGSICKADSEIEKLEALGASSITGGGPATAENVNVNTGGGIALREDLVIDHPEFSTAFAAEISGVPGNTWDVSIQTRNQIPVKKNDWVVAHFFLRGHSNDVEGANVVEGGAVTEFVFETAGPPYTKSIQYLAESEDDESWSEHWIRFRSLQDYDAKGALINFQSGYQPQHIEIGGLQAWTLDASISENELPSTPMTYPGRSRDAKWRQEAAKRIESHRKTNVVWKLTDENGQPLANVPAQVELIRHDFDFGTAVSVGMFKRSDSIADKYRETLLRYFNAATIENGLKWKMWQNRPDNRKPTLDTIQWLNEKEIPVRGHVMVWPGKRYLPEHVIELLDEPSVLGPVIDTHIREVAFATRGQVRDWDVLNEVFDNPDLTGALGDEAMINWFKQAEAILPKADLYYNDYAGLVRGGFPTGHKRHFERTVRYLVEKGAPIDGLGIQGHFGSHVTPPARLMAELDRWGSLGLKVLITEFDVEVSDPMLQADFTEDFLTCCFSHPSVTGVLTWGFYKDAMWKPRAALFESDWSPTPSGQRWIELSKKRWTTQKKLTTNEDGELTFRGFKGQYVVRSGERTWNLTTD